jgi:hypothetical protein
MLNLEKEMLLLIFEVNDYGNSRKNFFNFIRRRMKKDAFPRWNWKVVFHKL